MGSKKLKYLCTKPGFFLYTMPVFTSCEGTNTINTLEHETCFICLLVIKEIIYSTLKCTKNNMWNLGKFLMDSSDDNFLFIEIKIN